MKKKVASSSFLNMTLIYKMDQWDDSKLLLVTNSTAPVKAVSK